MSLTQYFQSTFSGELTNSLFIVIIFGLVITDLRKYFPIEKFFEEIKIKNVFLKIFLFSVYYFLLISAGTIGVYCVVAFSWLIS